VLRATVEGKPQVIPNVIFNYRKKTPAGLKNQHIISIVKMKNGITGVGKATYCRRDYQYNKYRE
jgi:hypothetical protein